MAACRSINPRAAVRWFLVALLALHVLALLLIDVVRPDLRDPEYGRRIDALRLRMKEHPGRPVVVVIGSSRAAQGVCPGAWEGVRPAGAPLLFNLSRLGGGPLAAVMALRRMRADGVTPDAVVLEFWPPLLREDGPFEERAWINPDRLYLCDRPFARDYLPDPEGVERAMLAARLNPVFGNRRRWLARLAPSWVPSSQRVEPGCRGLDGWGWSPGLDEHPQDPAARAARLAHHEPTYRRHLAGYAVHPLADRALREAVALARQGGARVALAYLPESTEFRGWYPPEVERVWRDYLDALRRELGLPLIDARRWLDDALLADGFHPTRVGAAELTRRFGPAVGETLGGLRDGPAPCGDGRGGLPFIQSAPRHPE
jgi:hypothetical protein